MRYIHLSSSEVTNECFLEAIKMGLPLHSIFVRVHAVGLKKPKGELLSRNNSPGRQKVRHVPWLPVNDAAAPASLNADFVHQSVER